MSQVFNKSDLRLISGLGRPRYVATYICSRCGVERANNPGRVSPLCHECKTVERRYQITVPDAEFFRIANELGRAS